LVNYFFVLLQEKFDPQHFHLSSIFNVDETAIWTVSNPK